MQRRQLLAGLFCTALFACSSSKSDAEPSTKDLRPLTVDQVDAKIKAHDGHTYIFDDNPKESWVKAHVPTAKWLDEVTADALPIEKTATLIFYCHNET